MPIFQGLFAMLDIARKPFGLLSQMKFVLHVR